MSNHPAEDDDGDHLLALPRGTMLSEYRIDSVLGQGGFGITYLAHDTLLNEAVAVKEYFPNETAVRTRDFSARAKSGRDRDAFAEGLKSFLTEAQIIARFRHPNIMQVRRFFEAHGTGYIVLGFVKGQSLEEVMASAPLPEPVVMSIFAGILEGLSAVHERAILHRDLKPRNVIVREDGVPVLIDFGAARDFGARNSLTVTKIASPGYSSPEQYGVGEQQGPWSDFYSLGAILYRAVTARVPPDALKRLRNDPLVPASKLAGGRYNPALLRLIDRMMQIGETQRPTSADEIRKALPALEAAKPVALAAVTPHKEPERPHDWTASRSGKPSRPVSGWGRRGAIFGLLAALVLGCAGGAFWFLRAPEQGVGPDVGGTLHEAARPLVPPVPAAPAIPETNAPAAVPSLTPVPSPSSPAGAGQPPKESGPAAAAAPPEIPSPAPPSPTVAPPGATDASLPPPADRAAPASPAVPQSAAANPAPPVAPAPIPANPPIADQPQIQAAAPLATPTTVELPKHPPALGPGVSFQDCPTCPMLTVLPPGGFSMGSADGSPSEKPVHHVSIPAPFAIGQREVTFAQWDACVSAGGCASKPSDHGWGRGDHPAIDLSWSDAQAYVAWLSKTTGEHYRLPTEAEWEYADRGGTTSAFWWGDAVGTDHANCGNCAAQPKRTMSPVGSYPANPFGLFDTAGNAAEWVEDCWTANYEGAPADGSAAKSGPCGQRVLRGGSMMTDARYLRSASRFKYEANVPYYTNGMRVAREVRQR